MHDGPVMDGPIDDGPSLKGHPREFVPTPGVTRGSMARLEEPQFVTHKRLVTRPRV